MKKFGAYEAKTKLAQLLDEVAKGEEVTITRHGIPVAKLIPFSKPATRDLRGLLKDVQKFRAKHSLRGVTIKELIAEGRK